MGEQYIQRGLKPLTLRALLGVGQHLHLLTILQLCLDRHKYTIYQSTNASATKIGVNSVGKVQHSGATGKIHNMALRRSDEYTLLGRLLVQQRA